MIPNAAAHQIFTEVWAEYGALLESDDISVEQRNFVMDVESVLKTLYPVRADYKRVWGSLMEGCGRKLSATRAAVGDAFLCSEIWPVRAYYKGR